MTTSQLYNSYKEQMNRIADIKYASALLQWDQETYLPVKAAAIRGQQIATLSELAHQFFTDEKLGNVLNELKQRNDLSEDEKRNVELTLEDYTKNKKYSSDFVRKISEQVNKTFHSWIEARKKDSFSIFENDLDALVQLKRQETEILGYEKHPYNALLNEFEKGCTVDLLDKTFTGLLPSLKELLDRITGKEQVDNSFLKQHYPKADQWNWGMYLIKELNFDFEAGRQDISEHPFTINFSSTGTASPPTGTRWTSRENCCLVNFPVVLLSLRAISAPAMPSSGRPADRKSSRRWRTDCGTANFPWTTTRGAR